jgi:tRNA U34 5-methylaminomethyl-2-thiouridine-forming methyltransferase MnmC
VRFAPRVSGPPNYDLVHLANGVRSIRSRREGETFHPVIGPAAEAEALYVRQLHLAERMRAEPDEFVIWDVGLGGGANVLTVLDRTRNAGRAVRIVSFDHTLEPLEFARQHAAELGYFAGYEQQVTQLIAHHQVEFEDGTRHVRWEFVLGDFPALMRDRNKPELPAPHVVLFDAYSPARNPAMWTLPLFASLFQHLRPDRPCAMPTYSRSTLLRVTLLLAGFHVGIGHATGEKEETTIAGNDPSLVAEPLGADWLRRAAASTSAEPLREPVYQQARLTPESLESLRAHPQFATAVASPALTPRSGKAGEKVEAPAGH